MADVQPCASCGADIEFEGSGLPASAVCEACKGSPKRLDMTEEELRALGEACAADERYEGAPMAGSNRVQERFDRAFPLSREDQLLVLDGLMASLNLKPPKT